MGSQCNLAKVGVICSLFQVFVKRVAAKFLFFFFQLTLLANQ